MHRHQEHDAEEKERKQEGETPRKKGNRSEQTAMETMEEDRLTSVEGSVDEEHEADREPEPEQKARRTPAKKRRTTGTPRRKRTKTAPAEEPAAVEKDVVHEQEGEQEHEPKLPGAFEPTPADEPPATAGRGKKRPAPMSPPEPEPVPEPEHTIPGEFETPRANRRKTRGTAASLNEEQLSTNTPASAARKRARRGVSEEPITPRRSTRLSTTVTHDGAPPVPALPMSASMGSLSSLAGGSKTPRAGRKTAAAGKTPKRRGFRAESVGTEEGDE